MYFSTTDDSITGTSPAPTCCWYLTPLQAGSVQQDKHTMRLPETSIPVLLLSVLVIIMSQACPRHLAALHPAPGYLWDDEPPLHTELPPETYHGEAHADSFEAVDKLLDAGRWTDAEVMLHQMRSDMPSCPWITLFLGRIHYYRNNDRMALALFNKLAEEHPEMHLTYHFRGLIYADKRLHSVAFEEFHKVFIAKPDIGSGYFLRYILPYLQKDGRLNPAHIDSMLLYVTIPHVRTLTRGFLAFYQDDYSSALDHFKAVIQQSPDHSGAWLYAGRSYEMLRMALEALHCYNRAIAINDTYARAYLQRGLTKINEGNWFRGCRDLRMARDLEEPAAEVTIQNFCKRGYF